MRIGEIGEYGLLERLQRFCPADVVGDDGALLSISPGHQLVVSADTLIDGVHFSWGLARPEVHTTRPADAGWRAAAANLSDIAAMGARPLGLTVSLGLPPQTLVADIEAFYQGMSDCLSLFDVPIVGGDVCRSSVLSVAITALGECQSHDAIRRSTAQPGDRIVVTGTHGGSRAGLELLLDPSSTSVLSDRDRQFLIATHQRPTPRLDAIAVLRRLQHEYVQRNSLGDRSSSDWGRVAGMDSSDGLADAVLQLCQSSAVGAVLDRMAIPIPVAVTEWRSPSDAMQWALYGGEDFELVLCCCPTLAQALVEELPSPAAIIGTIIEGDRVVLTNGSSSRSVFNPSDEILRCSKRFQHFS